MHSTKQSISNGVASIACAVGVLLVGLVACPSPSQALTLAWDRNSETDMKDYQVYACFTPGCTVIKSSGMFQASIPQPTSGVVPSWPIPAGKEGSVAVSARDLSLNESGLSVSLPFDLVAPGVPANPRLQ